MAEDSTNNLPISKTKGGRRRGQQRMGWLDGITDSMDMSFSKLREIGKDGEVWRAVVHEVAMSQALLSDCATTMKCSFTVL